jgi:hypothetical protein
LACWLLKMAGTCGFALIFRVMAPEALHAPECTLKNHIGAERQKKTLAAPLSPARCRVREAGVVAAGWSM